MNAWLAPFVGIDVSQEHLDVAVDADGAFWHARNDEFDIQATVDRLLEIQRTLAVVESAGGFEWPLLSELYAHRIPVALVSPDRVSESATALELVTKTQKIHAHFLARLGEAAKFQPFSLPEETVEQLSALVTHRRQLAEMLTTEKYNRLNTPLSLRPPVEEHIAQLRQELDRLSDQIQAYLQPQIAPAMAGRNGCPGEGIAPE